MLFRCETSDFCQTKYNKLVMDIYDEIGIALISIVNYFLVYHFFKLKSFDNELCGIRKLRSINGNNLWIMYFTRFNVKLHE